MKKIQTVRSHTGHARFVASVSEEPVGFLPAHRMPAKSPYHGSPSYCVWQDGQGRNVLAIETSHKVYEIWQVDASDLCATDEAATEAYTQSLKPAYSSLPIRYSWAGR